MTNLSIVMDAIETMLTWFCIGYTLSDITRRIVK